MFSHRLQELRKSWNLSQALLAKELGVAQQTIAQWEKGTREPNIEMLIKISSFFSVSLDNLLDVEIVSDFDKMLDELDQVNKSDIKKFLNKLYHDTVNKKIIWECFTDKYPEEKESGIINYNLSFITDLQSINSKMALLYCSNASNPDDYTIMPEIYLENGNTTLPADPNTQRMLRKIHKVIARQVSTHTGQNLSNFINKYLSIT